MCYDVFLSGTRLHFLEQVEKAVECEMLKGPEA